MIVIQGSEIMQNWFPEGLPAGTKVLTSENGFTSDKIAIAYLEHYIANSDSGPDADWKIMLMDNHGSHCTPEFVKLANENRIRPYPLIPHLTHCMQPLDVGVFQPYKHWHDMAIRDALAEFSLDYSLTHFLDDLTKIRDHTFKVDTIKHAFKKSGMCPPNAKECIKQLKIFKPQKAQKASKEPCLPAHIHPRNSADVGEGVRHWCDKMSKDILWSDDARPEQLSTFLDLTVDVCIGATFDTFKLSLHEKRRLEEIDVTTSRKRLRKSGSGMGLTKEEAIKMIEEKKRKAEEEQKKKDRSIYMKLWRDERNMQHDAGLLARAQELARVKVLKDLLKRKVVVPPDSNLRIKIHDPEAEWKATNEEWAAQEIAREARKAAKLAARLPPPPTEDDGEEVTFITDTTGDLSLQRDFVRFDEESDDSSKFDDSDSDREEIGRT